MRSSNPQRSTSFGSGIRVKADSGVRAHGGEEGIQIQRLKLGVLRVSDQEGNVLDVLVQKTRDKAAA
ncbi:MAG: hypothetical protein KDH17_21815 [Rhodocyclaceae bacterium]|nr:hypothetical protein [Rhodocyclaceae bacterium]